MKTQLTSIEIHYLVKELQFLIDSKIDKIYHPEKKEILLQMHIPNVGKKILRILAGKYFYLTGKKDEFGEPSSFCMFLRKQLSNARLREFKQIGGERIIELVFEKKEGIRKVIIELFSKGNIILCDKDDIIISAVERQKWKDREIKPKIKYIAPKKEFNIFRLKLEDLKKILQESKKENVAKSLAVDLGIGGSYAEESCLISGIDKDKKPNEVKEIKSLFENILKILKQKIAAEVVYKNDEIEDITPFGLKIYDELKTEKFKTFNDALESHFSIEIIKKSAEEIRYEKEIKKIENIIERQEKQIKSLEKSEIETREKADLIYNNYKLISEIQEEIKKAAKKYSWKEIKERLKGHKLIKDVDAKEKKIVIELEYVK